MAAGVGGFAQRFGVEAGQARCEAKHLDAAVLQARDALVGRYPEHAALRIGGFEQAADAVARQSGLGVVHRPRTVLEMRQPAIERAEPEAAVLCDTHDPHVVRTHAPRQWNSFPRAPVVARGTVLRRSPDEPALVGQQVHDGVLRQPGALVEHDPGQPPRGCGLDVQAACFGGSPGGISRASERNAGKQEPHQQDAGDHVATLEACLSHHGLGVIAFASTSGLPSPRAIFPRPCRQPTRIVVES